jgi:periplasmic divalent cation tolerance protein
VSEAVVVLTTLAAGDDPAPLARDIVENRLAACVNVIGPIRSFYRWEGKIAADAEQLLLIKTTREHVEALREYVVREHPYDVPEFVVIAVSDISEPYLAWLIESTQAEA